MAAGILVLVIGGILLYFVPSAIAVGRDHPNVLAIFLLNLFLGWTILGWIAALVWSATSPARLPVAPPVPTPTLAGFCPQCGAARGAGAFCPGCGAKLG